MCSGRSKTVAPFSSEGLLSSSPTEEQEDGQTRSPSPRATRSAPDAAERAVRELWQAAVGGLPCPAHPDDVARIGPPATGGTPVSEPGVCLVSCALPPRSRRGLGAPSRGVWVGYHHGDRSVTLWGTSKYPRDPSALAPARSQHRPTDGDRSAGTLRRVGGTASGG